MFSKFSDVQNVVHIKIRCKSTLRWQKTHQSSLRIDKSQVSGSKYTLFKILFQIYKNFVNITHENEY